ncbi:MAG: hypothetical protein QM730_17400 [Anaerolineales bacterium]
MGDDFSTLQVHTGSSIIARRESLISVVREALGANNCIEVLSKDEFHNRVIVVGPAETNPWLTVYNSICSYDDDHKFDLLFSFPEFTKLVMSISLKIWASRRYKHG